MGAWIEIAKSEEKRKSLWSHPTWVRGLKLSIDCLEDITDTVAPHVGAWIEIPITIRYTNIHTSHPTWVRGLKFLSRKMSP